MSALWPGRRRRVRLRRLRCLPGGRRRRRAGARGLDPEGCTAGARRLSARCRSCGAAAVRRRRAPHGRRSPVDQRVGRAAHRPVQCRRRVLDLACDACAGSSPAVVGRCIDVALTDGDVLADTDSDARDSTGPIVGHAAPVLDGAEAQQPTAGPKCAARAEQLGDVRTTLPHAHGDVVELLHRRTPCELLRRARPAVRGVHHLGDDE